MYKNSLIDIMHTEETLYVLHVMHYILHAFVLHIFSDKAQFPAPLPEVVPDNVWLQFHRYLLLTS